MSDGLFTESLATALTQTSEDATEGLRAFLNRTLMDWPAAKMRRTGRHSRHQRRKETARVLLRLRSLIGGTHARRLRPIVDMLLALVVLLHL